MFQKKLGQRIADLRRTQQRTQSELAKKVGCPVGFISLVKRDVIAPSVAGLEKFARVLRVEEFRDMFTFDRSQRRCKARPLKSTWH